MTQTTDSTASRKRRVIKIVAISLAAVLVVVLAGGFVVYRHLEGNITTLDTEEGLGTDRPEPVAPPPDVERPPLNILLLGSDTREGQSGHIGGETPGLSDTTILLHLSADRSRAYGVSLPRDAMVERPDCLRKDGTSTDPGGLSMFNAAYAVGGPACTQRTVEQLTGIRIDHVIVVDFDGFKAMVDALGGVPVCVPEEVDDEHGHIHLDAGSYEVSGEQALDYVRVRNDISNNGDIGRMRRQQAFLASMAHKAISLGTLTNPIKLYKFLDAATKSLSTDEGLDSLKELVGLARQLRDIGLENIQFLTVPWDFYPPDHNRLVWAPQADRLWKKLKHDEPLTGKLEQQVITAADNVPEQPSSPSESPSTSASASPDGSPSASPSGSPSPSPEEQAAAEQARENGLCA
jgi:LCP family protein required for cell wall assembly